MKTWMALWGLFLSGAASGEEDLPGHQEGMQVLDAERARLEAMSEDTPPPPEASPEEVQRLREEMEALGPAPTCVYPTPEVKK